jgi:hypothetical protein
MAGKKQGRLRRWLRRLFFGGALAIILGVSGIVLFLLVLWRAESFEQFDEAGAAEIAVSEASVIVPRPGLAVMSSNNNVDIVRYKGLFYMAFRTAPTHFASSRARIIVLRSENRETWLRETEVHLGDDLREPRFLVFNDTLFLYFFRAGSNPFGFEPKHIHMMRRGEDGSWTAPEKVWKPGYVVWRVRAHAGKAWMSVYHGAGLYTTGDRPGEIRLLVSEDGSVWEPVSEQPQVTRISAEEGEFHFDEAGNLAATVRLETEGALVCTAPHDNLAGWTCNYTKKKYDSALMLRQGGDFYVIARRNIAGDFNRDASFLPARWNRGWNLVRYSLTRKRTCLYRADTEKRLLVPLLDLPSKGDTAFPGAVRLDDRTWFVVNYSAPLEGTDWPWLFGQITGTRLYGMTLTFPEKTPREAGGASFVRGAAL